MNLENFEAQTTVELALYNEIKKLKLEVFLMARERGVYPPVSAEVNPLDLQINDIDAELIKLIPSAKVRGSITVNGKIQVRAQVHFKDNPKAFGQIYFTDSIYKNKFEAVHSLSYLHRRFIEDLAQQLKD